MQEKREQVRILLVKYFLSINWLVNQLNRRGFIVTQQALANYIAGRRNRGDAERVLDVSIEILEEYGKHYDEVQS